MGNNPDDPLPDGDLLSGQLTSELFEQHQAMRLRIEQEASLREVIDLRLRGDFHGEGVETLRENSNILHHKAIID